MSETLSRAVDTQRGHLGGELPYSLVLELTVQDPDTIAELCGYPEGRTRDEFALSALRIGVLALRQARGRLDGDVIRRESERMLGMMHKRLDEHAMAVHERLTSCLKEYFDPQSGRFQERVQRLVCQDGELEQLLRRQIGGEESQLSKTLAEHFGRESPLMKLLTPDESQGVMAAMQKTLAEQLLQQREYVLKQFSLDDKESALARLVRELTDNHGKLNEQLQTKINDVVKEFSLDSEESALSRLVRNVDRAQRTITAEFSLDNEGSALSRLGQMLENTNQAIHRHLTLDDDQSALARLRKELFDVLERHNKASREFQQEVKVTLGQMVARREEADRSTRHGLEFQQAVFEFLSSQTQPAGDVITDTGNTTGRIKYCKVGDALIELGPDCAAAGARIVVEAKEEASYTLARAREEIEQARKNRDAQIGLFVFSAKCVPTNAEALSRYGDDVIVVWDAADPLSDVVLRAGLMLARALCVRQATERQTQAADFGAINDAILDIEKQTQTLDSISKSADSVKKNGQDILDRADRLRRRLDKQIEILREKVDDLRDSVGGVDAPAES